MNVTDFLNAVLPTAGYRYIFALFPDGRPVQREFAPEEQGEMLGFAQWALQKKQANVYFGVAGYLHNATGEISREAYHARLHRCLRIDVDCGTGKPYATKAEGARALMHFIGQLQLPDPWIVDSGGGLHAYWPFDADLPIEQWLPLATSLKLKCQQLGFHADHTITADAARVLRLPGTINFKGGMQRPVTVLHEGRATSFEYLRERVGYAEAAVALSTAGSLLSRDDGALSANMHEPYTMRPIFMQCPGLRAQLETGGATAEEPLWKGVLDLINGSAESEQTKYALARAVSEGHADFDVDGLHDKWAQVQRQSYHPPTCSKFADLGMAECATCPLRGSIRTPVALGRPRLMADEPQAQQQPLAQFQQQAPQNPQTPQLVTAVTQLGVFQFTNGPTVFIVDGALGSHLAIHNGIPCIRVAGKKAADSENGTDEPDFWRKIGPYALVSVERMLDPNGEGSVISLTFDRYSDGRRAVHITHEHLSDPRAFTKLLSANGLQMTSADAKCLQDKFMPEFMLQLQRARAAHQIAVRCGWTPEQDGFILGDTLYRAGGVTEHVRATKASKHIEHYHAAGDEAKWRQAFDIMLRGGVDRQVVLALSLGAPLMAFTGVDGVLLNAYSSESGVGKSTLCDAALSVWGAPEKLRNDYRDTNNATWQLAAINGNMPMVVDEFTNVDGKTLSDYIYTVTQGREKHRLTQTSSLRSNDSRWCLPVITTANNSVIEKLQSFRSDAAAEAARVLELRLSPLQLPLEEISACKSILLGLRSNYGFLGPRLAQLLLSRTPDYWRALVADRIAKWDREVATDSSDRFRSATAALIEIGAQLGAALGLAFDVPRVVDETKRQWEHMQASFETSRRKPQDFASDYVVDKLADFAVFGGPNGDALINGHLPRRYVGELRGRQVNGKFLPYVVIIPQTMLRDYIQEKNGNYTAFNEWARSERAKPDGMIERIGRMAFLEGQATSIHTQCVAFRPEILGGSAAIRVVTGIGTPVAAIPPALTSIDGGRKP